MTFDTNFTEKQALQGDHGPVAVQQLLQAALPVKEKETV